MIISNMTTFQVEKAMEENREKNISNVAVISTGSIEQHGPFLPLNTDSVIAEAVARAVDLKEGNRLFLYPPINYTNADSGMDYPGTLSVSHNAFRGILRDIVSSIMKQGYEGLLFIDGHAINRPSLSEVGFETVHQSFQEGAPFPVIFLGIYEFYEKIKKKYDIDIGVHADWFEKLLFLSAGGILPKGINEENSLLGEKKINLPGIFGIPLKLRSNKGVIGKISGPRCSSELMENIWRDLIAMTIDFYKHSLKSFIAKFQKQ